MIYYIDGHDVVMRGPAPFVPPTEVLTRKGWTDLPPQPFEIFDQIVEVSQKEAMARTRAGVSMSEWDESLHPRASNGEFDASGGPEQTSDGNASKAASVAEKAKAVVAPVVSELKNLRGQMYTQTGFEVLEHVVSAINGAEETQASVLGLIEDGAKYALSETRPDFAKAKEALGRVKSMRVSTDDTRGRIALVLNALIAALEDVVSALGG